ncbi:DUF1513 domain-containing protein, partial [Litorivivens sp.]|uniref:DUF1513 domain-containing protein n=1 Tax=Litorivivens sp. TaxID=2020868 RepID=UPI003561EB02
VLPAQASAGERIYSAATDHQGRHFLCCWAQGELRFQVPSPGRGHDVIMHRASNSVVFFARRPGRWMLVLDASSGAVKAQIKAATGRHFYGHGTFVSNGRYLLTAENDYANGGVGIIGIYDTLDNFKRLDQMHSGGVGPHQLVTLPDDHTVAVANGGILTLPDSDRDMLNLDTMQPSLCYLDSRNAMLLDEYRPPHHQLSLRHLDVDATGEVTIGAQFEGPAELVQPLLFRHRGQDQLQPLDAEVPVWQSHAQYIASVACADNTVVATSPRGNCISIWKNGAFHALEKLNDVAGAAFNFQTRQFVTSNGRGQLVALEKNQMRLQGRAKGLKWDNHMDIAT